MAKVKVTVTYEEYGEFDIGDISPRMFRDLLATEYKSGGDWNLSEMGADWKSVRIEVEGQDAIDL